MSYWKYDEQIDVDHIGERYLWHYGSCMEELVEDYGLPVEEAHKLFKEAKARHFSNEPAPGARGE